MHPVIDQMTAVINITDRLLLSAQKDEWDGFDEALVERQALLEAIKADGAIESTVTDGFGELAAELLQRITEQNETMHKIATEKHEAISAEMATMVKGDKVKTAYKL